MEFLIVTGMSGSGKSKAMDALEDFGFYCIDNVPPALLHEFVKLFSERGGISDKVAIGVDVRSGEFYNELEASLDKLLDKELGCQVLFLDCDDSVLLNRYKETRRKHPLLDASHGIITDAIASERKRITPIRRYAQYFIDTSHMSPSELKEHMSTLFLEQPKSGMNVLCVSYGTKYGSFNYADCCFDVRCLPNPFYVPELKHKTGLDDDVYRYVFQSAEAVCLRDKLYDLMDYVLPLYLKEGKSQIVLAFCCTGGKHRSVSFARAMAEHLKANGYDVTVNHRDIGK